MPAPLKLGQEMAVKGSKTESMFLVVSGHNFHITSNAQILRIITCFKLHIGYLNVLLSLPASPLILHSCLLGCSACSGGSEGDSPSLRSHFHAVIGEKNWPTDRFRVGASPLGKCWIRH